MFCVYCPDKRAIPVSPPVTAVTPVLSDAAVERLTTGFSAHHDHHTHAPEVLHPYQDIHAHHHKTPAQVDAEKLKREAYLHKDIYLHTVDEDIAEVVLHQTHRHAMNHPEEGIVVHHEQTKHIREPAVPHHDLTLHLGPHQHEVDKKALHRDLHLHHDMFLSSEDTDIAEVTVHRNHPHAANHPEEGFVGDHGKLHRPAPIETEPVHAGPSKAHPEKRVQIQEAVNNGASDADTDADVEVAEVSADGEEQAQQEQEQDQVLQRMSSRTPPPPNTPLYGLFTVMEEGDDGAGEGISGNHSRNCSPVTKLSYGSPYPAGGSPEGVPHLAVPKSVHLQIVSAPSFSGPAEGIPASEIVAMHASTRFKKRLMDIDGLWHLFQDFNVVPYLFK